MIKTLDLNDGWNNIKDRLNTIAELFKKDAFQ
jgi:hypothetical protein